MAPVGAIDGRSLVTGGAGFVGRHLTARLRQLGSAPLAPSHREIDLRDVQAVHRLVEESKPATIFHLAALASVRRSWAAPAEPLLQNLSMTLNVLEAVRTARPEARVVVASSGEVYGTPEALPVDERAPLRPQNPYAVSKAACDLLGGQYADSHGLRVVRTRAFNHCGPGQSAEYVVGSLTRQLAVAELAGKRAVTLRVGALDVSRDFTDVRDVVRAYLMAAGLDPAAYNVCSGCSVSVRDLIERLRDCTDLEVSASTDAELLRPVDATEVRGAPDRLAAATGWSPEVPLERSVRDAVDAWRARLQSP